MELDAFLSMCANDDLKALLKEGGIPLHGPYDGEDGDIKYTKKAHYIYALVQSGWGRAFVSNTGVNVKSATDALNDRLSDLPINAQSARLIGVDDDAEMWEVGHNDSGTGDADAEIVLEEEEDMEEQEEEEENQEEEEEEEVSLEDTTEWEALPISSANYMDVIPVGFERQDGDMYSKPGVGDRIIVNFSDTGWSCGLVESSLVAKVTRGGTNGQMCDIDPRKRANFSVLWPCEVVDGKTLRSSLFLGKNNVGSVWALIGEK